MNWEAWSVVILIVLMALALIRNWFSPVAVLLGGLTIIMTLGIFSGRFPSVTVSLQGFANEGLITIGVLYVIAEGLGRTGAMSLISQSLLGRPRSLFGAQLRLLFPVAAMSGFLNNTPIVAMFMPVVTDWCRKTGLSASKLFIPLSYAAILGGCCTLIGTAANLVVHGLVVEAQQLDELSTIQINMFTNTPLGICVALAGLGYILIMSPVLLPSRDTAVEQLSEVRRYTVEMLVEPGSPIVGKSIERAGLRHLPGVYLMEVVRDNERLVAVGPEQVLYANDRLIFVGAVDSVVDLRKIRGLIPATDQVFKLREPVPNRCMVEAVVSNNCPLVGKSIREGRFRTYYDAVVIAVHRQGEHLKQRIGDIVLRPGDTLLMEAPANFVDRNRYRLDFFMVSAIEGSQPVRHDRVWPAMIILVLVVAAATFTPMRLVNAALWGSGLMILFKCCTLNEAISAVNWRVLLVIGSALGIGRALDQTGAANHIAYQIIELLSPMGERAMLAAVYMICMLFTSIIGPVGAVAMVFPIVKSLTLGEGLNFMPFVMSLMMIAASSFATPIGYQTNLMVYGAGGYRFSDYLKFGIPLNLIVLIVVVIVAPMIWPFY